MPTYPVSATVRLMRASARSTHLAPRPSSPSLIPSSGIHLRSFPNLQSNLHPPATPPHPTNHHFSTTPTLASSPAKPPTSITPGQPSNTSYHKLADTYIDALVASLEELQEAREDIDVEYSAGVLTLIFPPNGTYVLNKQPPNKQIWLSSPVSGPKRYDYVRAAEGEDGGGEWVYLRDGTTLSGLLREEVGISLEDW